MKMGRRATFGLSRRAVMMGMAATSLSARPGMSLSSEPDVVIIGAGAAGISAAKTLLAQGKNVIILEAANRTGGRAYTESAVFGAPYDHGCASLQGPEGLPHVAIAHRHGFDLHDHSNPPEAFFVKDRPASFFELGQFEQTWSIVNRSLSRERRDVAAASVIDVNAPFLNVAETWLGPIDAGVDMDEMSTADWNGYANFGVDYLVKQGLGALVACMADGLPIRLATPATAVDWGGDGVVVDTPDGAIRARACIVTVSTGVLASGAIRFTPGLPAATQDAIANLPMGTLQKIGLQFDGARFGLVPNSYLYYAFDRPSPAEACFFLTFPTGHDYVVGYVGGSFGRALSKEGADVAIDFALAEFLRMMGSDARKHFVKGHLSDWNDDPLTHGAYSAARPGHFSARADLAQPVGERIFFAGEAVATPYAALVSGAHLSGERVAAKVIETLDK